MKKYPVKSDMQICCLDPESGLYHQVHFKSVLGLELARLDRWERPLSLIVFELPGALSAAGWVDVGQVVRFSLRRIDLAARIDSKTVCVIMPDADGRKSRKWLADILNELNRLECLADYCPNYGWAVAHPWEGRQGDDLLALALDSLSRDDLNGAFFEDEEIDMESATAIAEDERSLLFDGFKALENRQKH